MSGSSFVYGVDFGMTTSSLAIMRENGEPVLVQDPAIRGDASQAVPTAVWAPEDPEADLLVGQAAVNAEVYRPLAYRDNFKRDVQSRTVLWLDERRCEVVELVAAVLRFLYQQAQAMQEGAPEATVLTAPADWAKGRRDVLTRAAIEAGYPRESLFIADEPTAAIEYARSLGIIAGSPRTLIYDLGGSTIDCAAVVPGRPGLPDPRATSGREIGGINFDKAIMAEAKERFPSQFAELEIGELGKEEPWHLARVQRACETIKRRLSSEDRTHEIFYDLPGRPELLLSREEFNALITEKVDETIGVAHIALKKLGLRWQDVDVVLPIGGSTQVPLVQRRLHDQAPGKLREVPRRDFAVALGAAVMAWQRANEITAAQRPLSAAIATASPWTYHAAPDEPNISEAAKPPRQFNRFYLAAVWLVLVPVMLSMGALAWMHWALAAQIFAGLWCLVGIVLGTAFVARPSRNSATAEWLGYLNGIAAPVFLVMSAVYGVNHEKMLALWSLGTGIFLIACAVVSWLAGGNASRARTTANAYAHDQEVIRQVSGDRWFGGSSKEIPDFLAPLFEIPALRGFQLRVNQGEEERYALAAGGRVLLVAMLTSPDQRPVLEQWEGSLGYRLPPGSVRTILVAPGSTPPRVPADEEFAIAAMITTRPGVVDIVGRWLERDNRLLIPLLSALLRSA
jgi:molecular chaperone DnaK